ncbi:hypothetical protein J4219_09040 [Candidatus Woesearchaeota archaeon]|nr:hypothetical protein [Candidatus Woesearchaeota archaeon]
MPISLEKQFLVNWQSCHKTTSDFLNSTSDSILRTKPFHSRFRSFAWEFACLVTTRQMYISGFMKGKIDETSACDSEKSIELSSQLTVKTLLEETNKQIGQIITNEKIRTVNFWGTKTDKLAVLSWLMQHEQLHYGKLILYLAQVNQKLPSSIKEMWGRSSFQN